jgi:putative DNA primase/helicase
MFIPFDATFTKADPDYRPLIKYELREQEAVERLIMLGIRGLKRILENDAFTVPKKAVDALAEYEKENNSIISFIEDFGIDNIANNPTKDIYNAYSIFCMENGLKEAYSNISFSLYIRKRYGFDVVDKKIQGAKHRIFVKRKDG